MNTVAQVFALIAAIVHVLIFCMESLWFMQLKIYQRFGAKSAEEANIKRLFAFNQGFYNLFLAIGVFIGIGLIWFNGSISIANTLILFNVSAMLGAAIVLYFSAGKMMLPGASIQGVFPLLVWLIWLTT